MHDRQLEILRAIVDEYVTTQEPVGSKAIAERHSLGVSPATIRNDMANWARSHHDSAADLYPILEALEEQVVLLKLLSNASGSINVKIGEEQPTINLASTSSVSMGAGAGAVGILGPTRMDYSGSMGAVHAVARYIGKFFEGDSTNV